MTRRYPAQHRPCSDQVRDLGRTLIGCPCKSRLTRKSFIRVAPSVASAGFDLGSRLS